MSGFSLRWFGFLQEESNHLLLQSGVGEGLENSYTQLAAFIKPTHGRGGSLYSICLLLSVIFDILQFRICWGNNFSASIRRNITQLHRRQHLTCQSHFYKDIQPIFSSMTHLSFTVSGSSNAQDLPGLVDKTSCFHGVLFCRHLLFIFPFLLIPLSNHTFQKCVDVYYLWISSPPVSMSL